MYESVCKILISTYPKVRVSVIFVFCLFLSYFAFYSRPLPRFEDPQLGFQTKYTEISKRIATWDLIVSESTSWGNLTINPRIPEKVFKKIQSERYHKGNFNSGVSSKRIGNYVVDNFNTVNNKKEYSRWDELKQLENQNIFKIYRNTQKFMYDHHFDTEIHPYNSQIIFTSEKYSLFSTPAILEMCKIQSELSSLKSYQTLCITRDGDNICGKIWSLPNIIVSLTDIDNCHQITDKDIMYTYSIVKSCLPFYKDGKLDKVVHNRRMPPVECLNNLQFVHKLHFILSKEFQTSQEKKNQPKEIALYLGIKKGVNNLQLYHDIEGIMLNTSIVTIKAMDLGVKYGVFHEYLLKDLSYLKYAIVAITLLFLIYTACVFVTLMEFFTFIFSAVISYILYIHVLGIQFFSFLNISALIIVFGFTSTNANMFLKIWYMNKLNNPDKSVLINCSRLLRYSTSSILPGTLVAVCAFFSLYRSEIIVLKCFSVFICLCIATYYILLVTWVHSGLVMSTNCTSISFLLCYHSYFPSWFNIKSVDSQFGMALMNMIKKFNKLFIITALFISAASCGTVLMFMYYETSNFKPVQLFHKDHPFEQFDINYENEFFVQEHLNDRLPLRFIWGVVPKDSGNSMDPNSHGELQFDSSFEMSSIASQEWMVAFCKSLRSQPFYHHDNTLGCFIEVLEKWMADECRKPTSNKIMNLSCCPNNTYPNSDDIFHLCTAAALNDIYKNNDINPDTPGPRYIDNQDDEVPVSKILIMEFYSQLTHTNSFPTMDNFYNEVENWMRKELSNAPSGLKNGWFVSYFSYYDTQKAMRSTRKFSAAMSFVALLTITLFVTRDTILYTVSLLTSAFTICTSFAMLECVGYTLGSMDILEEILIPTMISISFYFPSYIAVLYNQRHDIEDENTDAIANDDVQREENRLVYILNIVLNSSSMTILSIILPYLFLISSDILPYSRTATFLLIIYCISWLYSIFFQVSLLLFVETRRKNQEKGLIGLSSICNRTKGSFKCFRFGMRRNVDETMNEEENNSRDREFTQRKSFTSSIFKFYKSNPIYPYHDEHNRDVHHLIKLPSKNPGSPKSGLEKDIEIIVEEGKPKSNGNAYIFI